MPLNNGGGSYPCNIDTIFTVFTISFKSAITLLFRYACPPQEQPLVSRPPCFLTHELTILLLIFCRFACHSQHPQGSWHLRCLVFLWQYRAVVHWIRGLPSVSQSTQITLLSLLFEFSSCARFTRAVLLVWDVARHGISTPFLKTCFFSFQILILSYELFISLAFFSHYPGDNQSHEVYLQLSDETIILCLQTLLDLFTSRIHPPWTLLGLLHNRKLGMGILNSHFFVIVLPFFSVTNQVITNHTRNNVRNLTGKLYFVCIHCWLYLRPVSTLHEPCRGCAILESMGWEFWTPSRGRSAWWRHPCWMFIS